MQLTLQEVELRLRRWHTRLTRASNEVAKLEKKRRRLVAGTVKVRVAIKEVADEIPLPELDAFFAPGRPEISKLTDDLTIPPLLKRTEKPDMERLKRLDEKRRGRSRFGASDMPLTGRDAMKAIKDARRKK